MGGGRGVCRGCVYILMPCMAVVVWRWTLAISCNAGADQHRFFFFFFCRPGVAVTVMVMVMVVVLVLSWVMLYDVGRGVFVCGKGAAVEVGWVLSSALLWCRRRRRRRCDSCGFSSQ